MIRLQSKEEEGEEKYGMQLVSGQGLRSLPPPFLLSPFSATMRNGRAKALVEEGRGREPLG